jgi:hypothetical protein
MRGNVRTDTTVETGGGGMSGVIREIPSWVGRLSLCEPAHSGERARYVEFARKLVRRGESHWSSGSDR